MYSREDGSTQLKDFILLGLVEAVSLGLIAHLWLGRKRLRVMTKWLWTLVLLFPGLGPVLYGFAAFTPSAHNDPDPGDHTGTWSPPGMEP
jgi:hypothetical protein